MNTRVSASLLSVLLVAQPLLAQVPPSPGPVPNPGLPPAALAEAMAGLRGSSRDQIYPPMEEVTRDLKRADGLFTLFYSDSERAREPEKLLALIPGRVLNQDLLFATTITQGGPYTGWMWDDALIRLEVRGRYVVLVLPEVRYPTSREHPLNEVIQKTYNARILATAPIVTMNGAEPVIDLGPLLKSNLAGLPTGGGVRADLSKWIRTPQGVPAKIFPDNLLVQAELAVGFGDSIGLTGVAYSVRILPPLGAFQPRGADDRVGYFLTARRDLTRRPDAKDTFERFINRWNLVKRDPSLDLSPPVQPIRFYIERTVPIQWRRWVRQGIEAWNQAFEKIGFTGAIEVLQQTDTDYRDLDPEDSRYNFIRWIVSGRPFAMGPSRADPRTGQILDADIIFDDSMVRSFVDDLALFTPRHVAEAKGPGFVEMLKRYPHLRIPNGESVDGPDHTLEGYKESRKVVEERFAARGQSYCDFSVGYQRQMGLAFFTVAIQSGTVKVPERLVGETIREVVMHEVGHTLGLRHNFKASSWLTPEEIQRRRATDEPTSGSVMDYNPILILPKDSAESSLRFVTPNLGPYDFWAIEYGYKVRGPQDPGDDEMLSKIAARCAEPGLAYATDEDTLGLFSPDPFVNRFDMSSDPYAWTRERLTLVDELLKRVGDLAVGPGESRYLVTRAFDMLLAEKGTALDVITRWIGGVHFHRDHKGDPNARTPFVLVSAQRQREGVKMLQETILSETYFKFPPELLNQLAPPRWSHWGAPTSMRLDYPIHNRIRLLQWWTLVDLISPPLLQRVYDAELKSTEDDRFTVSELIRSVQDHVWATALREVGEAKHSDQKPFLSSIARGLQREHLELLLASVLSPADSDVSPDLHALLCGAARDLLTRLKATTALSIPRSENLDAASRAHLLESRSRLERVLDAQFQRRG